MDHVNQKDLTLSFFPALLALAGLIVFMLFFPVVSVYAQNILVRTLNPEGVFIQSIQYISGDKIQIYDGDNLISLGYPNGEGKYEYPIPISPGFHIIKA